MSRLSSLRSRLTAIFVVASTLVVLVGGFGLIRDQASNASERLDAGLLRRIDAVELALRQKRTFPYSELYGEVIDADYRILGMSRAIELPGLLSPSQADFVLRNGSLQFTRADEALGGPARFSAQRRTIGGAPRVIVVGVGENTLQDSQRRLRLAFFLVGPGLVLLLGLGGWALSGAALRPVKRMTDDAAAISQFASAAPSGSGATRIEVSGSPNELHHLGSTLNAMLDRLEASYRRERSFVDDASHELRTPLAVLRGELELALLRPGDAASTRASLERSIEEVDRLAAMTDDLLVLARTDRLASEAPAPEGEPIITSAEAVVAILQRVASRADRVPVTVAARSTKGVVIRAERLERVVSNLVSNAQRFAERTIVIGVDDIGADRVAVIVEDDGPGFPPEFLPQAFERFSVAAQSRARRSGGGVGLGLAIVRALTNEAGGAVRAENRESGGARVVVEFRARPAELSSTAHAEHATTVP